MSSPSRRELIAGLSAFTLITACKGGADTDSGGVPADSGDSGDSASAANDWASGGTAAMAASYPSPFGDAPGACALTCGLTLGPCYAETFDRADVSEGITGLPVSLHVRVVDAACRPIAGAKVDIWHTSPSGLYSGEEAAEMCTTGDEAAIASSWFRGVQTTDADGTVAFKTCFPGWYSGRAIHIHFQIRRDDGAYLTSQLFFPQEVIDGVFASHPEYVGYGTPNRTNATDGIAQSTDLGPLTLEIARMDDGIMQAFKTVVIADSAGAETC